MRIDNAAFEHAYEGVPFGPRKGGERRASAPRASGDVLDDLAREVSLRNVNAQTVIDVKAAVMALPKSYWDDSRARWVQVAMALKSLAEAGYESDARNIWHEFSSQNMEQYTHTEADHVFNTAHPQAITFKSIFHWAKDEGVMPHASAPTPAPDALGVSYDLETPSSIPPRQWVYGDHYVRKFVSTTVAPGGSGKSVLALIEAVAIATGRPLLGVTPKEVGPVWYFNAEDPLEETRRRLAAISAHYEVTNDEIKGKLFLGSGRQTDLIIAVQDRTGVRITETPAAVKKFIQDRGIIVAIVDPFVSTHRVNENDNGAIDAVVKQWNKIAESTNCAVELVHHVRKGNGASETTVDDGRGASALLSAARSARVLNRMTPVEAKKLQVGNHMPFFHVTNGKANFAPASDKRTWYKFISFDMNNGDFGEGDSVGVVTRWHAPEVVEVDDLIDPVLAAMRTSKVPQRCNPRSENWLGYLVARVAEWDLEGARVKKRTIAKISEWESTGKITRSVVKDEKSRGREAFVPGDEGVAVEQDEGV